MRSLQISRGQITHFAFSFSRPLVFAALVPTISMLFFVSAVLSGASQTERLPVIPSTKGASAATALVDEKKPDTDAAQAAGPMREMHIANNGAVYLRGARIIALHDSSIDVSAGWGSMNFNWSVSTKAGTHFINARGNAIGSGALKVGDIVTVTGALDQGADAASMRAQYIRVSATRNQ